VEPRAPAAAALIALLPFALHALAREVDRGIGFILHTSLDLPGFVPLALSLVDWGAAGRAALAWTALGAALWLATAAIAGRAGDPRSRLFPGERDRGGPHPSPRPLAREKAGRSWPAALGATAWLFAPLLLRPALTLLALAALAWRPAYPYGFTLPVALTQDWSFAQDAAAAAALVAGLLAHAGVLDPRPPSAAAARRAAGRLPRSGDVFLLAFLAYGLLTPAGARSFDAHPGNEPKYLRMALALGHGLTLDVDTVTAPMEALPVTPPGESLPRALRRVAGAARDLGLALGRGEADFDPGRIEAAGVAHLTVRGRDGGAYHVLAPGPAFLLAPALRLDRALNLRLGTPGRIGVTLLLWNLLAAALVAAVFALARAATGRAGVAAAAAGAFALLPPQLFYSFQFYPELPAALVVALALRALVFGRRWDARVCLLLGLGLAALPWLHQKYLPLWAALGLWALVRAVDRLVPLRALLALVLPQALALGLVALYNFAVTGSARPDALFRALGREGVSLAHAGQGALGLLLDARYGLVPYVPLLLLAAAGLLQPGGAARRLRRALPAAGVYYLTVAAAENWTGSISNLGRFLLPLVPLAAAFAALALVELPRRPAALALGLMLTAWSARLAWLLWHDPPAANDSGVLLGASTFADGHVYLPNLLLRSWSETAPALPAQLVAWVLLGLAVAWALRARPTPQPALTASRALALAAVCALALAWGLERWPGRRGAARFPQALRLDAGTLVFVSGDAQLAGDVLTTVGGEVTLVVRSATPLETLRLRPNAPVRVDTGTGRPRALPAGAVLPLPLTPPLGLRGRRGNQEFLTRARLRLAPASHSPEPLGLTIAR
jgi:hypothetical protein